MQPIRIRLEEHPESFHPFSHIVQDGLSGGAVCHRSFGIAIRLWMATHIIGTMAFVTEDAKLAARKSLEWTDELIAQYLAEDNLVDLDELGKAPGDR